MTGTQKLLVGASAALAAAGAWAWRRNASVARAKTDHYCAEAEAVDRELYRRLRLVARSASTAAVQWRASEGAQEYRERWLNTEQIGRRLNPRFKRRLYGKWCQAGNGGGEPIDEIDEACRWHDHARAAAFARCDVIEASVYA